MAAPPRPSQRAARARRLASGQASCPRCRTEREYYLETYSGRYKPVGLGRFVHYVGRRWVCVVCGATMQRQESQES